MEDNKLKPCPFCGSSDVLVSADDNLFWSVSCNTCSCEGPSGGCSYADMERSVSEEHEIKKEFRRVSSDLWNKRIDDKSAGISDVWGKLPNIIDYEYEDMDHSQEAADAALCDAIREKQLANKQSKIGYMDYTDYCHELPDAPGGTTIYGTLEEIMEIVPCAEECGVVKVAVVELGVEAKPSDIRNVLHSRKYYEDKIAKLKRVISYYEKMIDGIG